MNKHVKKLVKHRVDYLVNEITHQEDAIKRCKESIKMHESKILYMQQSKDCLEKKMIDNQQELTALEDSLKNGDK